MEQRLSFFNWSIKKLLFSESDSFSKAKIKIVYSVLLFSILKVLVVLFLTWFYGQSLQLGRAVVLLVIYVALLKLLLNNTIKLKVIAHILIWLGILLVISNILFFSQTVNLVSLQFVFMVTLSSFYLLGTRYGIIYSILGILPVIIYMSFGNELNYFPTNQDTLFSPAFEIIAFLNFTTIVFSHYLFQQAFLANVKEKEALNEQLKIAVKEANQAAQSKSDFLSTMSHELRTPLNSVIGMTNLFLDDTNSSDRTENLNILKFSAVSLHSLINDILDFNKLGADKLNLEAINVNLYELINDICLGLRYQANEKGIDLILDIDEVIKNQEVITDPTRITQIIYNLVGNALKFTSKGSVTVCLKAISISEENINIKFSILDTGIGISKDKQEEIFEPFNQASTSTTRDFGGTGLGLAIVKRLLLLLNSHINLESGLNTGSNFFFEIVFKLTEKVVLEPSASCTELDDNLSDLRILVAEDNLMNRILLKKVLSKWKNEPVFTENGQEALEKSASQLFDVILMDLHMPVMDGYTAAKAIRNLPNVDHSTVHIIAFTASVSNNLSEKVKDVGMNDYMYKPFNPKELYGKLKDISVKKNANNFIKL
ncbi:ATP-binding protein [Pedobacter cryophilus]|uniref:histidine kinase n=1 Tax=Pedobacter cryophilus TaxID=2571271 RepID=A0A4U1BZ39_9SPHI|nr:ATP-binding protein [Pedobacter cryophilus]TKB97758.1 response regulator [Pedobacter cryophilus]